MGDSIGVEHIAYKYPSPNEDDGVHNYMFLLYEQQIDPIIITQPECLAPFDMPEWIQTVSLCGPVASITFTSTF